MGEVGWEQIRLGGHDYVGEAFVAFQQALKGLSSRGIILALASRNEERLALEAIDSHPDMVLRRHDFVAWQIHWGDKATSVASLAAELNIGLSEVVFIDDHPAERARVREALPEVMVPEWPEDPALYADALAELRAFDALSAKRRRRQAGDTLRRGAQAQRLPARGRVSGGLAGKLGACRNGKKADERRYWTSRSAAQQDQPNESSHA